MPYPYCYSLKHPKDQINILFLTMQRTRCPLIVISMSILKDGNVAVYNLERRDREPVSNLL